MKLRSLLATALFASTMPLSTAAAADRTKLLPFWSPQLEAARFGPANEEFAWVGWIGATVELAQKAKWGL